MLNWYLRYRPIMSVLESSGAEDVLDVGSGWFGLSWYWPYRVIQTDIDFSGDRPREGDRAGQAVFVCSTAEKLPFANNSFDFALSSDMLEHLPEAVRAPSVAELTRVARRGVIVGFPTGSARIVDLFFARLLRLRGHAPPAWLSEHLAQVSDPDRRTVEQALPVGWEISGEYRNGNALFSALVGLSEMWGATAPMAAKAERRLRGRTLWPLADARPVVRVIYLLMPVPSAAAVSGFLDHASREA